MNLDRSFLYSIGFCGVLIVTGLASALILPDNVALPIHWNASGAADGFADKWIALLINPFFAFIISLIFYTVIKTRSLNKNIDHNSLIINLCWISALFIFTIVQYAVIASALRLANIMPNGLFIGIALMFGFLGNYLPKLKPSPIIGIRTPWTLKNEWVWIKTHRLGGKLLMVAAVAIGFCVVAGFSPETTLITMLLSLAIALISPAIWSYFLWQQHKDVP